MMNARSMIRTVAVKEIREIIRDGRLRLLGGIVVLLTLAALAFGVQQTELAEHQREHAQERAEQQWQGQGKKNPHVAAHYGTHIFAPTSVATAIDPGVSAYMGRSVKAEAHKRNLASHSAAEDGGALSRMGSFSVATVLLQLVPLLIIALGYGLWSLERERGTLRQVMSTGVDRRHLFWGKAIALAIVLSALLLPAALIVLGTLTLLVGGGADTVIRLATMTLSYGLYFTIFGSLTLWVSAQTTSSRASLVVMIGIWVLFCLVLPRGATEVAVSTSPLPSQSEVTRNIQKSLEKGIDGQSDREEEVEKRISALMAEQGIENAGLMISPAILNGIELQAEAMWEDEMFNHHVDHLEDQITAQEQHISWGGLLSPYIAMRTLSSGLSGTDYAHHRHFTTAVEEWRKSFVTYLNVSFAENAGTEGWNYQADPQVWKNAPAFTYTPPTIHFALQNNLLSLLSLLLWTLITVTIASWSANRIKVSG